MFSLGLTHQNVFHLQPAYCKVVAVLLIATSLSLTHLNAFHLLPTSCEAVAVLLTTIISFSLTHHHVFFGSYSQPHIFFHLTALFSFSLTHCHVFYLHPARCEVAAVLFSLQCNPQANVFKNHVVLLPSINTKGPVLGTLQLEVKRAC